MAEQEDWRAKQRAAFFEEYPDAELDPAGFTYDAPTVAQGSLLEPTSQISPETLSKPLEPIDLHIAFGKRQST